MIVCRLLTNYLTFFHSFLDPIEIQKLKMCYLDGVRYAINETMEPDNDTCYTCVCTEDFDNATAIVVNPNCRRIDCLYEIHHFSSLRRGCVPLFFRNKCCAISVRCRKCFGMPCIFHSAHMNV